MASEERRDLGTHVLAATDLHETRHTKRPVTIDPPVVTTAGVYDPRTGEEDGEPDPDKISGG